MFIIQATNSYSKRIVYYSDFSSTYTEVTADKEDALTLDNLFEVKQLVNKHSVKSYKIIEIKE